MDGIQGLVQTVSIMSVCIVFLAKHVVDFYKKKKDEAPIHALTAPQVSLMVAELHKWHAPHVDPESGQSIFMWYENNKGNKELRAELESLKEWMQKTCAAIENLTRALEAGGDG